MQLSAEMKLSELENRKPAESNSVETQSGTVKVVEFEERFQRQVEELVLPIQTQEFGVKITREEQPDLLDIKGTFQRGDGNFWVVLRQSDAGKSNDGSDGANVIGTIGVVDIGNKQVALKKMFVRADARGKVSGIAQTLMDTAKEWCRSRGVVSIILGTTAQMFAAHRFYEKNGFVEQQKEQLPPNFPIVHVDTKFYRCDL